MFRFFQNSLSKKQSDELSFWHHYKIGNFDYDFNKNELYIHDVHKDRLGVISLSQPAHQQWRSLVVGDLAGVMMLSFDVNSNNLYWIDHIHNSLEVVTSDGKYRAVVSNDLMRPVSMAISHDDKKIYVGCRSNPSRIYSMNMDGSKRRTLAVSRKGLPLAIGIAQSGEELLWGDPVLQKIEFIDLKGPIPSRKTQKLIENSVNTIHSMAVSNQSIFWTTADGPTLFYAKISGEKTPMVHHKVIQDRIHDYDSFKVVAARPLEVKHDSCQTGKHNCSHICLLAETGYSCLCSQHYESTDGGVTCTKTKKEYKPFHVSSLADFANLLDLLNEVPVDQGEIRWDAPIDKNLEPSSNVLFPPSNDKASSSSNSTTSAEHQTGSKSTSFFTYLLRIFFILGFGCIGYIIYKK